jgi:hypothetical protein
MLCSSHTYSEPQKPVVPLLLAILTGLTEDRTILAVEMAVNNLFPASAAEENIPTGPIVWSFATTDMPVNPGF